MAEPEAVAISVAPTPTRAAELDKKAREDEQQNHTSVESVETKSPDRDDGGVMSSVVRILDFNLASSQLDSKYGSESNPQLNQEKQLEGNTSLTDSTTSEDVSTSQTGVALPSAPGQTTTETEVGVTDEAKMPPPTTPTTDQQKVSTPSNGDSLERVSSAFQGAVPQAYRDELDRRLRQMRQSTCLNEDKYDYAMVVRDVLDGITDEDYRDGRVLDDVGPTEDALRAAGPFPPQEYTYTPTPQHLHPPSLVIANSTPGGIGTGGTMGPFGGRFGGEHVVVAYDEVNGYSLIQTSHNSTRENESTPMTPSIAFPHPTTGHPSSSSSSSSAMASPALGNFPATSLGGVRVRNLGWSGFKPSIDNVNSITSTPDPRITNGSTIMDNTAHNSGGPLGSMSSHLGQPPTPSYHQGSTTPYTSYPGGVSGGSYRLDHYEMRRRLMEGPRLTPMTFVDPGEVEEGEDSSHLDDSITSANSLSTIANTGSVKTSRPTPSLPSPRRGSDDHGDDAHRDGDQVDKALSQPLKPVSPSHVNLPRRPRITIKTTSTPLQPLSTQPTTPRGTELQKGNTSTSKSKGGEQTSSGVGLNPRGASGQGQAGGGIMNGTRRSGGRRTSHARHRSIDITFAFKSEIEAEEKGEGDEYYIDQDGSKEKTGSLGHSRLSTGSDDSHEGRSSIASSMSSRLNQVRPATIAEIIELPRSSQSSSNPQTMPPTSNISSTDPPRRPLRPAPLPPKRPILASQVDADDILRSSIASLTSISSQPHSIADSASSSSLTTHSQVFSEARLGRPSAAGTFASSHSNSKTSAPLSNNTTGDQDGTPQGDEVNGMGPLDVSVGSTDIYFDFKSQPDSLPPTLGIRQGTHIPSKQQQQGLTPSHHTSAGGRVEPDRTVQSPHSLAHVDENNLSVSSSLTDTSMHSSLPGSASVASPTLGALSPLPYPNDPTATYVHDKHIAKQRRSTRSRRTVMVVNVHAPVSVERDVHSKYNVEESPGSVDSPFFNTRFGGNPMSGGRSRDGSYGGGSWQRRHGGLTNASPAHSVSLELEMSGCGMEKTGRTLFGVKGDHDDINDNVDGNGKGDISLLGEEGGSRRTPKNKRMYASLPRHAIMPASPSQNRIDERKDGENKNIRITREMTLHDEEIGGDEDRQWSPRNPIATPKGTPKGRVMKKPATLPRRFVSGHVKASVEPQVGPLIEEENDSVVLGLQERGEDGVGSHHKGGDRQGDIDSSETKKDHDLRVSSSWTEAGQKTRLASEEDTVPPQVSKPVISYVIRSGRHRIAVVEVGNNHNNAEKNSSPKKDVVRVGSTGINTPPLKEMTDRQGGNGSSRELSTTPAVRVTKPSKLRNVEGGRKPKPTATNVKAGDVSASAHPPEEWTPSDTAEISAMYGYKVIKEEVPTNDDSFDFDLGPDDDDNNNGYSAEDDIMHGHPQGLAAPGMGRPPFGESRHRRTLSSMTNASSSMTIHGAQDVDSTALSAQSGAANTPSRGRPTRGQARMAEAILNYLETRPVSRTLKVLYLPSTPTLPHHSLDLGQNGGRYAPSIASVYEDAHDHPYSSSALYQAASYASSSTPYLHPPSLTLARSNPIGLRQLGRPLDPLTELDVETSQSPRGSPVHSHTVLHNYPNDQPTPLPLHTLSLHVPSHNTSSYRSRHPLSHSMYDDITTPYSHTHRLSPLRHGSEHHSALSGLLHSSPPHHLHDTVNGSPLASPTGGHFTFRRVPRRARKANSVIIHERLEKAGLQVKREALKIQFDDTNCCGSKPVKSRLVLLKITASLDRLECEAESMQLMMRLKGGGYMPFTQSIRSEFQGSVCDDGSTRVLFRSSERQLLLDRIIRSKNEDGGAYLVEGTPLGQAIVTRFPLHMYRRLQDLESWVSPWSSSVEEEESDDETRALPSSKPAVVDRGKGGSVSNGEHGGKSGLEMAALGDKNGEGGDDKGAGGGDDRIPPSDPCSSAKGTHKPPVTKRRKKGCCGRLWWKFTRIGTQPIDKVSDYYGEEVAFYFAWLEFYTKWLILPALLGAGLFAHQLYTALTDAGDASRWNAWGSPYIVPYSVAICVWVTLLSHFWKRTCFQYAYHWGVLGFESGFEAPRPEFEGEVLYDAILNKTSRYYPAWKRGLKLVISTLCLTVLTLVGSAIMIYLFDARDSALSSAGLSDDFGIGIGRGGVERNEDSGWWEGVDSPMLFAPLVWGAIEPLFDRLYTHIAAKFNEWENWRLKSSHENSFVIKVFTPRMFNCFIVLYYYALADAGVARISSAVASFMITSTLSAWVLDLFVVWLVARSRVSRLQDSAVEEIHRQAAVRAIWVAQHGPNAGGATRSSVFSFRSSGFSLVNPQPPQQVQVTDSNSTTLHSPSNEQSIDPTHPAPNNVSTAPSSSLTQSNTHSTAATTSTTTTPGVTPSHKRSKSRLVAVTPSLLKDLPHLAHVYKQNELTESNPTSSITPVEEKEREKKSSSTDIETIGVNGVKASQSTRPGSLTSGHEEDDNKQTDSTEAGLSKQPLHQRQPSGKGHRRTRTGRGSMTDIQEILQRDLSHRALSQADPGADDNGNSHIHGNSIVADDGDELGLSSLSRKSTRTMSHPRSTSSFTQRDSQIAAKMTPSTDPDRSDAPFTISEVDADSVKKLEATRHLVSNAWIESQRPQYSNFSQYSLLMLQLAFVALFSATLPLAPLIVMIKNLIDIRTGAWKLTRQTQRPLAHKASGIGVWQHVIDAIGILSIITNCALVGFTTSLLDRLIPGLTTFHRLLIVVAAEHILLLLRRLLFILIPTIPDDLRKQLERERNELLKLQADSFKWNQAQAKRRASLGSD